MANKASPDQTALECRGAAVAEALYARFPDGLGIVESAELLYEVWTQGNDVRMHAIADGFRRQAYIIAQGRAKEHIMAVESELWTDGRQGAPVCIIINDYDYKIIAWASNERLTSSQMVKALEEEYPGITFDTRLDISPRTIHAIGMREL